MRREGTLEPAFFAVQRDRVEGVILEARGAELSWSAPVAVIDAPRGFGEEVWLKEGPDTVIAWQITGADVLCEWGPKRGTLIQRRNFGMTLQPKGVPNHFSANGPIKFGQIVIRDELLACVSRDLDLSYATSASLRTDLINLTDSTLHIWLNDYAERSCCLVAPPSRLEMEARALLIVERLISHHHALLAKARTGGLAPWQLRRTCEAMVDRLDAQIGLSELAAIAGCSPTHFSRAFKQSTGVAPFYWLNERRIEKAKLLLENNKLSLAEIALAVGFSAQPQFTTAFGRSTGMTPGRWRREKSF